MLRQFVVIAAIFCVVLLTAGCSSSEESDGTETVDIQAQTVPTLTPTPTNTPKPTPVPTATSLPTELIEPISPVSPITTTQEVEMTLADDSVEPIPGSEEALAAAVLDLSEQTNTPVDQIKLVSVEPVDWGDTSLGCPQEGFMYAQVITPGYLLILEAQGQQYEYHTDQKANVILCEQ